MVKTFLVADGRQKLNIPAPWLQRSNLRHSVSLRVFRGKPSSVSEHKLSSFPSVGLRILTLGSGVTEIKQENWRKKKAYEGLLENSNFHSQKVNYTEEKRMLNIPNKTFYVIKNSGWFYYQIDEQRFVTSIPFVIFVMNRGCVITVMQSWIHGSITWLMCLLDFKTFLQKPHWNLRQNLKE